MVICVCVLVSAVYTVCHLLFSCHPYVAHTGSHFLLLQQAKRVAEIEKNINSGQFRPSGVRPNEIEPVFTSILDNVQSSIMWIKSLKSSNLPPVTGSDVQKARNVDFQCFKPGICLVNPRQGRTHTILHFWQVCNIGDETRGDTMKEWVLP